MKKLIFIVLCVVSINSLYAQIEDIKENFALPKKLSEASGSIFYNDKLIVHNDSGNENKLYELDTLSGNITREITIVNAKNIDWEDLTQDETHIYIGDIGDNHNKRAELKIYKIDKKDYLVKNRINAEVIRFKYAKSENTVVEADSIVWDSEALISFNKDNLMLFNKDLSNVKTKAFIIPKTVGDYLIEPLSTTLESEVLVTGATYDEKNEKLYLIGYNNSLQPYVLICKDFEGEDVFSGENEIFSLGLLGKEQSESITLIDENTFFITSESYSYHGFTDYAKLISIKIKQESNLSTLDFNNDKVSLYPNPVKETLYIKGNDIKHIELINNLGFKIYEGNSKIIDVSQYKKGVYYVIVYNQTGESIAKKIIIQ